MPSKIAERIDGMGRRLTNVLPSMKGGFLTNKWMLYLVLFSAVFDLFYFYGKGDMYALTLFFIIGFLVSFFSKNMVVILILAIVLTHLIRYGKGLTEGFEEDKDEGYEDDKDEGFEDDKDEGYEDDKDEGFEEDEDRKEGFEEKEEGEGFEDEDEKRETFEDPTDPPDTFKDFGGSSAYKIDQTSKVVNGFASSDIDAQSQALIDNQNKLMDSIEKFKPIMKTAQGFLQSATTPKKNKKDGFATLEDAYKPLMG